MPSNISQPQNPRRLRKAQISDQAGLGLGLRSLYEFPDDADAAGLAMLLKTAAFGKVSRFSSA